MKAFIKYLLGGAFYTAAGVLMFIFIAEAYIGKKEPHDRVIVPEFTEVLSTNPEMLSPEALLEENIELREFTNELMDHLSQCGYIMEEYVNEIVL